MKFEEILPHLREVVSDFRKFPPGKLRVQINNLDDDMENILGIRFKNE